MSLNRLHDRLTLGATAVALACLAVASGSMVFVVMAGVGVVMGIFGLGRPFLSPKVSDWLGFGGGACLAASAYASGASLLDIAAYFLVCVQVFKLPARKRELDFRLLYAFGVLDVGVAAAMTFDLSFGLLFCAYAFCAVWALIVHSIWLAAPHAKRDEPVAGLMRGVVLASTLALVVSVAVFVFFPRIGARFLGQMSARTYVSGVSDVVDLTDLGPIRRDKEEVMRVQLEGVEPPRPSSLYIRGATLPHYQDGVWRRHEPGVEETLNQMGGTYIENFPVWGVRDVEDARALATRYCSRWRKRAKLKVWLKPLLVEGASDQFIYVVSEPMWLLFKGRCVPKTIYVSPSGTLIWGSPQNQMAYYEVECALLERTERLLMCRSPRFFHATDYLQLPPESPGFPLSKIRELAETICLKARANTPYQMACAIERWLSRNLRYTYSPSRRDKFLDPTYEFLFRTREGHCELFASAMALMLRCVGVACRVVTGFRGGVYNSVGGFFVVRRENAHAWVEVLLDDDEDPHNFNAVRWVTFDPTPPYRPPERGLFWWVSDIIAYLRHRWLTHVVLYGSRQQEAFLRLIGATGRKAAWSIRGFLRGFFSGLLSLLQALLPLFIIGASVVVAVFLIRKRPRRERPASEPAVWFYRALLKAARKRGLHRRPSQTPFELLPSLVAVFGREARRELEFLTRCFVETRYGGRRCEEEARLKAALDVVLQSRTPAKRS